MARRKAFTKKRREAFLQVIRDRGNVTEAAETIGMSRQYMYDLRDGSEYPDGSVKTQAAPEFKEEWEAAEAEYLETCENEMKRRAYDGVKRLKEKRKIEISDDGTEKVLEVTREATTFHSDDLLKFHLTNRHPDYQRATKVEMSGPDGRPIEVKPTGVDWSKFTYEEKVALRDLLDKGLPDEADVAPAG